MWAHRAPAGLFAAGSGSRHTVACVDERGIGLVGAPVGGGPSIRSAQWLGAACPARVVRPRHLSFNPHVQVIKFKVGADSELRPHRARKRTRPPRRIVLSRDKLLADEASAFRSAIEMVEAAGPRCKFGVLVVWPPSTGDAFLYQPYRDGRWHAI